MNRFIQTHYDTKRPPNYYDYMNNSLLPLETVLKPFLSKIDGLEHHMVVAKCCCRYPSNRNLTKDEAAALYLYTNEWSEQCLHHAVNQALTSGNRSMIESWFGFLKLFSTALEKLPTVKNTIWRGVHNDIAKSFQENEEITWWNASSCSFSVNKFKLFHKKHAVLCSIEALNAKDIRSFTCHSTADEVVLLPGTRLRVKRNAFDPSIGQHVIHLIELNNNNHERSTVTKTPTFSTDKPPDDASGKDKSQRNMVFSITTFSNGTRYEVIEKDGKKQNYGIYYDVHGEKYDGYSAYSRANGDGFRTMSNGDRYEGTFRYDKMNGYGSLLRADGYTYVGNWTDDEANGNGNSTWPNGNHYEGDHENGKIQGRGTFDSINRDKYEGSLTDGKACGRGLRIWSNGDRYEGNFKDDKKHGFGTYYYKNGGKYTGDWTYDAMHGKGLLKWPSGTQYEGTFKNGKRHGWGKLIFANGQVQNGRWDNDKYTG